MRGGGAYHRDVAHGGGVPFDDSRRHAHNLPNLGVDVEEERVRRSPQDTDRPELLVDDHRDSLATDRGGGGTRGLVVPHHEPVRPRVVSAQRAREPPEGETRIHGVTPRGVVQVEVLEIVIVLVDRHANLRSELAQQSGRVDAAAEN